MTTLITIPELLSLPIRVKSVFHPWLLNASLSRSLRFVSLLVFGVSLALGCWRWVLFIPQPASPTPPKHPTTPHALPDPSAPTAPARETNDPPPERASG